MGASVLWYFIRNGENKGKDLRRGLQVYAHGGLSFLSNSSSVAFSQDNSVQAHTDYKGSGEANLKLSEQRAQSVKNYLVSQGVFEKRLIAKGYGESQPIADNETEEGRAKNRRVELKVIKDDVTEVDAE
ncbi:MAG: OmpA family protein [Gammaproteobacteria bacterium]|nr:OmpA family protein [Gammaproteobacteria bacterium]